MEGQGGGREGKVKGKGRKGGKEGKMEGKVREGKVEGKGREVSYFVFEVVVAFAEALAFESLSLGLGIAHLLLGLAASRSLRLGSSRSLNLLLTCVLTIHETHGRALERWKLLAESILEIP